jgi:hypothetical protein
MVTTWLQLSYSNTLKLQSITRKSQQCSVIGKIEHRLPSRSFPSFKICLPRRPLHGGGLCRQRKGLVANICRFESIGQKSELFRTVLLQHRFTKTFATEEFISTIPATCLCSRVHVGCTAPTSAPTVQILRSPRCSRPHSPQLLPPLT